MRRAEQWLLALSDPGKPPRELPIERLCVKDLMVVCAGGDAHGVLPGVWNNIEQFGAKFTARVLSDADARADISAEIEGVRKRLAERYAMTMYLSAETRRLVREFSGAGIEVIGLKGMDFATRLYAQPALRPFSDIDLLVGEQDWETVGKTMSRLGYMERETALKHATGYAERTWEHPTMPGAMVEVHDNLVNSPTIRRGVSVRLEDLPVERRADGMGQLTAAGLLIIAAVHGATSHSFDKLQHLGDVAQIARGRAGKIDEAELKRVVEKTGAAFCVAAALDLAERTFRDGASGELLERLHLRWPRRTFRWLITPETVVRSQGPGRRSASWRRQLLRQMLKSRR